MEDKIVEYLYTQYITFDEAKEMMRCLGCNDGNASWFDVFEKIETNYNILSIPNEHVEEPESWKDVVTKLKYGEIYYV